MSEKDFCIWLRGFQEASGQVPTKEQWTKIKNKLDKIEKGIDIPFSLVYPPIDTKPIILPQNDDKTWPGHPFFTPKYGIF